MRVDVFDFVLPEELIALRPVEPKHGARQLIVNAPDSGAFLDRFVWDMTDFLTENDLIIFNDTKVIPSYLFAKRGDMVTEVNLHKRVSSVSWLAFAKKTKRLKEGDALIFGEGRLCGFIEEKHEGGEILIRFDTPAGSLEPLLAEIGMMPLPPYIASKRAVDRQDFDDYQTIFAQKDGAVAAPTASLHFTPDLLEKIASKGIKTARVTLHVGAGTFLPVKADDTADHLMHAEYGCVSSDVAKMVNDVHDRGGRIVAVGTTVLRILESASSDDGRLHEFDGDTSIFITPGYKFKCVDILMTNFHLPKSTLFMLVSAFAGFEKMRDAYKHAIDSGYRFYSYGDSSLLFRG
ncbi:MAG: tRNA preQ1(34) S-adenosylmethionine ribosyltransferase-isomerase QueA [Pseudobdellovibrionaceae bacterium]|jgi:S-adenosylmethionine:tRNA ribosyltransferase-isomerase|nr:tRNA preQ1(34) S-adenosylmethionine ribosyltransferase-isomerase QueA [Pseudobdellovibrionaceae bacterium]